MIAVFAALGIHNEVDPDSLVNFPWTDAAHILFLNYFLGALSTAFILLNFLSDIRNNGVMNFLTIMFLILGTLHFVLMYLSLKDSDSVTVSNIYLGLTIYHALFLVIFIVYFFFSTMQIEGGFYDSPEMSPLLKHTEKDLFKEYSFVPKTYEDTYGHSDPYEGKKLTLKHMQFGDLPVDPRMLERAQKPKGARYR